MSDAETARLLRDRNDAGRPENARPRDRFGAPLPRGAVDEMPDREEPKRVVDSVAAALDRAAELFDQTRFFEAHEFLEYIWKSDEISPSDRDFWKGVTQIAVGCCHTQRGNAKGAVTLLERAARYMAPYPDVYGGVAAHELAARARRLAQEVRREGPSPERTFFAFPRVGGDVSAAPGS